VAVLKQHLNNNNIEDSTNWFFNGYNNTYIIKVVLQKLWSTETKLSEFVMKIQLLKRNTIIFNKKLRYHEKHSASIVLN